MSSTNTVSVPQDFAGKVVLITGGTSGIGRDTAVAFAKRGASVVVTGRREEEGKKTVDLVKQAGGKAAYFKADAAKEADAKAMVEFTVKTFGRLDVAFNNAGIEGDVGANVIEQGEKNYRQVFDINVGGVLFAMKYEIPAMVKNGTAGGAIINTSSVAGSIGLGGMSVYVASKHAVNGLSKTAALETAKLGVRINTVSPAAIQTDMMDRFVGDAQANTEQRQGLASMHPIGRVGQTREIAEAVVFLASSGASFITGTDLLVDGGFTAQ